MSLKPAGPMAGRMAGVPPELAKALATDDEARAAFDAMPPSHKRRYAEWVSEAKKEEARARRAAESLGMMRAWARERGGKRG